MHCKMSACRARRWFLQWESAIEFVWVDRWKNFPRTFFRFLVAATDSGCSSCAAHAIDILCEILEWAHSGKSCLCPCTPGRQSYKKYFWEKNLKFYLPVCSLPPRRNWVFQRSAPTYTLADLAGSFSRRYNPSEVHYADFNIFVMNFQEIIDWH